MQHCHALVIICAAPVFSGLAWGRASVPTAT
jgi:hypothetical protein